MDDRRFDALTRFLSDAPSRRGALATLLGGALGLLGVSSVEAKKKKGKGKGKKKKKPSPSSPPAAPPPPASPPVVPPPACIAVQETCTPGSCCGGRTCGDNFCAGDPPVCCGDVGAACSEACDCCGQRSSCGPDDTCICSGLECNGVCTSGECCPGGNDCPTGQVCQDGTCTCSSGFTCGDDCCSTATEVCEPFPQPGMCLSGDCSAHPYGYCTDEDYFTCGERCDCVTSVNPGVGVCTDDFWQGTVACSTCTTNAECVTQTGVTGAICVPGGAPYCNSLCPGNLCVTPGCTASSPFAAASSAGKSGKSVGREAAAKPQPTKQAVAGKTAARSKQRSRRKRRR